jgi:ligand-binding sensor domain-containing protein
LEISNREEVQGLLPTNMFGSVDASQVSKGKLIKPQLPKLSHQGRIGETASPLFETTTSSDRYEYSGNKNAVGTGTTPYAFFADSFGQLTIGTSNGVLRTNGFDSFVSGSDPTTATIDTTVNVNGITVGRVSTDDIVKASTDSIPFSGRYSGSLLVMKLSGGNLVLSGEVVSPSLTPLDDGRILVSGGEYYDDNRSYYFESNVCYIYDPTTKAFSNTGSMNVTRVSHAAIRLPNGNVMVSGGAHSIDLAFGETFEVVAATFAKLSSCEIFDIASQTWEQVSDMGTTRSGHGFTVMSDAEILVTGGQTSDTSFDDRFSEVSDPAIVSNTCEIYAIDSNSFAPTGSMERPRFNHTAKLVAAGSVVVESAGLGSELYTRSSETWDLVGGATEQTQTILQQGLAIDAIDGIVKKFFMDSSGILYALTRNSIFFAPDEMTFGSMKGLESIGVVHAVGEASGTLFAATDLGVYEITPDIKSQYTWFQGGLIGSGTTETFDLLAIDGIMFAGTEIGLFKTADSGDTWTSLSASFEGRALGDIYNIEVVGSRMFVQSDDALFYSDDQSSWTLIGRFAFLERESSILSRDSDLFVTSSQGLWVSSDGATFSLVDFDRNRDAAANNVSMIGLFGSDVIVGYDNEMYAVGLDMSAIRLAQFVGTVPTVMVNGTEVRSGFRYDDQRSIVVFEFKRLFSDVVSVATDYQDYYLDPWYGDGPDAPVTIFVNGSEEDFSSYSVDSRLGKVSFSASLDKSDAVSVSIANVTLTGAGEFFHDELEDRMSLSGSGLTLSMENDHSCNILQMGLSIEHNFLERGLERNQYYCLSGSNVDRGMTSFLTDAEFYILGRRDFDRFNSTIDYVLQSESDDPGQKALVPLSILEYSASQLWVGTEGGIFVLDPTNSFSVSPLYPNNQVNGMMPFNNEVWVVTDADIFSTSNGIDFVKNDGGGLPESTFCVSNVAGIPLVGTNDGIYYSDDMSSESFDPISNELVPAYFSIWFKASFSDTSGQEIAVTSPCRVLLVAQGTAYAAIDNVIYFSIDGKSWTKAYVFPAGYGVSSMSYFSYKLYVGTTNGLWTDNNTIRSTTASMTLESVQGDPSDASFSVNDLYSSSDTLVAVGDRSFLYSLNNGTWTSKSVPDVGAIHKVFITSGERLVAVSNDTVFSE